VKRRPLPFVERHALLSAGDEDGLALELVENLSRCLLEIPFEADVDPREARGLVQVGSDERTPGRGGNGTLGRPDRTPRPSKRRWRDR
jgi:hypothetical protein